MLNFNRKSLGLLAGAALFLVSATSAHAAERVVDTSSAEAEQWMGISADQATKIEVRLARSDRSGADDVDCRNPVERRVISIAPGNPLRVPFNFRRQSSPGIALYMWNVCFVLDHIVRRAWRGRDPGPGALLHANCFVTTPKQGEAGDDNLYLCSAVDVSPNVNNYALYERDTPSSPVVQTPCSADGPLPTSCRHHRIGDSIHYDRGGSAFFD